MTTFFSKALPAASLLLACAVTACGVDSVSTGTKLEGSPVVLGVSSPTARRQIALDIRPAKKGGGDIHSASLGFSITPSLQGAGSEEGERPWLRARVLQASDGLLVSEGIWVLGEPEVEGRLSGFPLPACAGKERCEAAYVLEFERQGLPTAGEIHITWNTSSGVIWTDPDASTVAVTLREE